MAEVEQPKRHGQSLSAGVIEFELTSASLVPYPVMFWTQLVKHLLAQIEAESRMHFLKPAVCRGPAPYSPWRVCAYLPVLTIWVQSSVLGVPTGTMYLFMMAVHLCGYCIFGSLTIL